MQRNSPSSSVTELARIFLKLGATSFGGPAAHISMMEEECVHHRQWISRDDFLKLLALANLIPGPNSTELAIHIGYRRAGWKGFWIAGACFILPAFLIVLTLAYFYSLYAKLPETETFLSGVKAVILAIILQALGRFILSLFDKKTYRELFQQQGSLSPVHIFMGTAVGITVGLHQRGISEIPLLFVGGALAWVVLHPEKRLWNLGPLFWVFFKIGSVLFGSGYVLLSFLQTELLEKRGWITQTQLLDAVAVGQFTPGPVFTTATFVGYLVHGPLGATVATLGIFLPAFVFVALSIVLHRRLENSESLQHFLKGVVAVSVGLLISVFITLAMGSLTGALSWTLFLLSLRLLARRIPSAILILGGGIVSLLGQNLTL
ncbi:chromate efflux transporter [Bdellovibrio bacteriovorus]|uniref:chromate efflux transporter n=1 Tax=Bdellovibrio bacteriovorus TaxID=959 RepID=UPI0021D14A6E|nr:chromate efflux transporter [Bdellovibrio bacteriovorus]UXR63678.1 chromate efflux transporter [Bdellovibrio bacteriovorus]